jgi:hypothetical protein
VRFPEITDPRMRLLYDLWQTHRDGAPAPRLADLDVFDSPHWLGHLSLLEAIEDGLHFRYLIYGRALAAYHGRDLNGKTTRDLPAAVGNLVRREYLQAYADQRPVLVEAAQNRRKEGQGIASALRLPRREVKEVMYGDERRLALVTRTVDVSGGRVGALPRLVSGAVRRGGPPRPACPRASLRRRPGAAGCPPSRSGI